MQSIQNYINKLNPDYQLNLSPELKPAPKPPRTKKEKFKNGLHYRTEEQINAIENIRYPLFEHPNSHRLSSAFFVLKIIVGRERFANKQLEDCICKQSTIGLELTKFGYDKNLTSRQVRRIVKILTNAGLINKERSNNYFRAVNRYEATDFGVDVYNYIINGNLGPAKIIPIERKKEMNTENTEDTSQKKKCHLNTNPQDNINPSISRRDNTRWLNESIEQTNSDEIEPVSSVPWVSKIDLNAKPIDLDDPEWILSSRDPDPHLYRNKDASGSTLLIGKVRIPEKPCEHANVVNVKLQLVHPEKTQTESSVEKLRKNFRGPELDILLEILNQCNREESAKLCFITSILEVVYKIKSDGRKVMNFESLARAISKKVLNFDHVREGKNARMGRERILPDGPYKNSGKD